MGDGGAWCVVDLVASSYVQVHGFVIVIAAPRLVVKPPEPLALGEHRAALASGTGIDGVERRVGRAIGLVATDWRVSSALAWNAAMHSLWMHLPSSISTSPM